MCRNGWLFVGLYLEVYMKWGVIQFIGYHIEVYCLSWSISIIIFKLGIEDWMRVDANTSPFDPLEF